MTKRDGDAQALEDREGYLERPFIEAFLLGRGYGSSTLQALPEYEAKRVLTEASVYAGGKLAEVEARAHFIHEIHSQD